jgi:hypothetical protein
MPVTVTSEVSGYIAYNAWADDTDKGSAGAGDGSLANPYDTIDAAMASFTGITKSDVSVTKSTATEWIVEMVGGFALTAVEDLGWHDHGLNGFFAGGAVKVLQQGSALANEQYQIVLTGSPSGGWFRLERLSIAGKRLEERIAQRWLQETILADTVMSDLVGANIFVGRVPASTIAAGTTSVLIEHQSNADTLVIGGVRHFSGHLLTVSVMAAQNAPSDRTDYAAQRLSELFEDQQSITLTDGVMLRCVRVGQVDAPNPAGTQLNATDPQWQKLGILLDISIQQS